MRARLTVFVGVVVLAGAGSFSDGEIASGVSSPASDRAAERTASTVEQRARTVNLTVEVNGDILIHSPVWIQALADGHGRYDFKPMLAEIRPFIRSADLAICHIETPMTPRPPSGYPVFNTPTQLAAAIRWAGWRICDTASNHSLDQGQYGIDQTGLALNRAGVLHTGSFASRAQQTKTLIVTVKGVRVAFLAYTEMTNGIPLPHPWSVNIANVAAVRRAARIARRRGAQVVIVNFHWGPGVRDRSRASSNSAPPGRSRAILTSRRSSVSTCTSCSRSCEIGGKLVVFGEGQLLSNQSAACCPVQTEDGMLVFLHIVVRDGRSHLARITYLPTWDRHPDYKVLPVGEALRRHQAPANVLVASYDRTTSTVGRIRGILGPIPPSLH